MWPILTHSIEKYTWNTSCSSSVFQKAIRRKNQHFLWVWVELGKFGLMTPVILKSLCSALNVSLSTHWCAPLQVRSTGEGESCVRAASLPSPTASCCAWTSAPGTRPASSAPCVWARSPGPVTAGTACCTASTTMKSKNTLTDTRGETSGFSVCCCSTDCGMGAAGSGEEVLPLSRVTSRAVGDHFPPVTNLCCCPGAETRLLFRVHEFWRCIFPPNCNYIYLMSIVKLSICKETHSWNIVSLWCKYALPVSENCSTAQCMKYLLLKSVFIYSGGGTGFSCAATVSSNEKQVEVMSLSLLKTTRKLNSHIVLIFSYFVLSSVIWYRRDHNLLQVTCECG